MADTSAIEPVSLTRNSEIKHRRLVMSRSRKPPESAGLRAMRSFLDAVAEGVPGHERQRLLSEWVDATPSDRLNEQTDHGDQAAPLLNCIYGVNAAVKPRVGGGRQTRIP